MTTIELLRHAKAEGRKSWMGASDALRPLSPKGRQQAESLAAELSTSGDLAAIYSSPLTRCTQTCDPLSAATGVAIVTDQRIAEAVGIPVADNGSTWVTSAWLGGRALGLVREVVAEHEGARVVVCSHGDVIPALLAVLAGRDRIELPDVRLRKGARMTLTFDEGRCVSAEAAQAAARSAV